MVKINRILLSKRIYNYDAAVYNIRYKKADADERPSVRQQYYRHNIFIPMNTTYPRGLNEGEWILTHCTYMNDGGCGDCSVRVSFDDLRAVVKTLVHFLWANRKKTTHYNARFIHYILLCVSVNYVTTLWPHSAAPRRKRRVASTCVTVVFF